MPRSVPTPRREKLKFFGDALFIPIFFLVTGFLIEPVAFAQAILDHFFLVAAIVAALIVGKGVAAFLVGGAFGYSGQAKLEMWALTVPQVAATLAATLVGYDTLNEAGVRLLDTTILNAVLVLLVVTSILGPVLTELFTPAIIKQGAGAKVATA